MVMVWVSFAAAANRVPDGTSVGDSISTEQRINEVVVTGTHRPEQLRRIPVTVTVIDSARLRAHHRASILPALMEQVPGLMLTSRGVMGYGVSAGGSGGMMLRGVSSSVGQVMVLINGHPQYNGIFGHPISDSYQTMMADRVEVMRGPASLLYGSNAMGGVVNIVTRRMEQDGMKADVNIGAGSYGTVETEAGVQVKQGRLSATVSGQYGRSDNHRPHMGFSQYGGYADLEFRLSSHWNLFANADVTRFSASNPGTLQAPLLEADQWITRGVASVGADNRFRRTSGRLSVYESFGRHKINDGYAAEGGTPQTRLFRSKDALTGISWFQTADCWSGGHLTLGLDYRHIYGNAYYTDRETGEVLETQNKQSAKADNDEVAVYADVRQTLLGWLTLEAGLRYDHHTVAGGEWVPQGGIVVRTPADGEVKAMVGKGFRNPTMKEMYLYPPSNEELQPESMVSYELSWRQRLWQDRVVYGVNLFYLHADNIIQTVDRKLVNTGELENHGAELDVRLLLSSRLSLSTNHSYLYQRHPVAGAPTYKGHLNARWQFRRLTLDGGLTQVCGLYLQSGKDAPREAFTLLDLAVDYRLCSRMSIWLKGDNLLAQRYEINLGYPMPKATFMGGISLHL